jgi:hypothetical protein
MEEYARSLQDLGLEVTSRWVWGEHDIASNQGDNHPKMSDPRIQEFAIHDRDDLYRAHVILSFSETEPQPRGSRIFEGGMAYAKGKRCFVIGEYEHIFDWLPEITRFPNFDNFLGYFRRIPQFSSEDRSRFLSKIENVKDLENPDNCVKWDAVLTEEGYGQFWLNGKTIPAHQAAYRFYKIEVPEGCIVHHECHNRSCVNPYHLIAKEPALHTKEHEEERWKNLSEEKKEVRRERVRAMRTFESSSRGGKKAIRICHAKRLPQIGERNPRAKLKETQVCEILSRWFLGGITKTELAREFGVSFEVINAIVTRKNWKHIKGPHQIEDPGPSFAISNR